MNFPLVNQQAHHAPKKTINFVNKSETQLNYVPEVAPTFSGVARLALLDQFIEEVD